METKFKEVAHLYLGCKVQYVGIINAKDIAKYVKEYDESHEEEFFGHIQPDFNPPDESFGLKTGYLKRINWNKHSGNVYEVGTFQHGLKKYYSNSLSEVKPILYPISSITEEQKNRLNEIERNGTSYPTMAYALAPVFAYMLSQHFDLFGLIESGQAIDATNTPTK